MEHPLLQITLEAHEVSALELAFESFDIESKLIIDLGSQLVSCGASRELALALEDINPGMINKKYPLISFTQLPSKTNYDVAIEGVVSASMDILKKIGEAVLKFIKSVFKSVVELYHDIFKSSSNTEEVSKENVESANDFTDLVQGGDVAGSPVAKKIFKGEDDKKSIRVRAERVNGKIKFYNPSSGAIKFEPSGNTKVDKTIEELAQEGVDALIKSLDGLTVYLQRNPFKPGELEHVGEGIGLLGEEVNRIFFRLTLLQEKIAEERNNNTLTMTVLGIKELNKSFDVAFLLPIFEPAGFTPTSDTIREDMVRLLEVYRKMAAHPFSTSGDPEKDKNLMSLARGWVNIYGKFVIGMETHVKVLEQLDKDIKGLKFPPILNPKVDFAPSLVSEYHASARELYSNLNDMSSVLLSAVNIIGMIMTSHTRVTNARRLYEDSRIKAYSAMDSHMMASGV